MVTGLQVFKLRKVTESVRLYLTKLVVPQVPKVQKEKSTPLTTVNDHAGAC